MKEQFAAGLDKGLWRTAPQIRQWLRKEHGVTAALPTIYKWLGKAGARLRVPRPSHLKKDPAAAEAFKEEITARLQALELPAGRPVRLWVMDDRVARQRLPDGQRPHCGSLAATNALRPAQLHAAGVGEQGRAPGRPQPAALRVGLARSEFLYAETVDQEHLAAYYRQIANSDPAAIHVLI